jgi:Fe-S oxidoreductase
MSQEKFKPSKPFPNRVTFHDPCHLGRHHGEYEAPRSLLKSIPGLELAEMERNRDRALCCGGGGGNAFTGMLGSGPLSPARARINEAKELGASVLATACPLCRVMLAEEAKAMGEDRIKIMDLAEILTAATL